MDNLILRPRMYFNDGSMEDLAYTPMGALSGEEVENISIEEHQILKYHENYRKALNGEASWWEVYSTEQEVDAEIALQERAKAAFHERVEISIKQDASFFEALFAHKRVHKECEMAAFAVRFGQKPKITVKVSMVENE